MAFAFSQLIDLSFRGARRHISPAERPFLIAEFGLNHNRDIDLACRMVAAAAQAGADAVKLQSCVTDEFIHPEIEKVKPLAEIFRQFEIDLEFHSKVADAAAEQGLIFLSTPLTISWPQQLKNLGAPVLKIASGDLNNWQLLEAARRTALPLIISTGAARFTEVERTAAWCRLHGLQQVVFLHCVSLYPTPVNKANIGRMVFLREKLGSLVGFSDHTKTPAAGFAAVAAGAVVIEKHFTLDRSLPGPDQQLSATPDDFRALRQAIDEAFEIRGQQGCDSFPEEFAADYYGKRSLYQTPAGWLAMRPRDDRHPPASAWFDLL